MYKKRNAIFSILVMIMIASLFMYGCSKDQTIKKEQITKSSYSVLATSAEIYDVTLKSLADLYKQGKITDEQKAITITYGNEFWRAYHTAVDTLDTYYNSSGTDAAIDMSSAISTLATALTKFLVYSKEIGGGV